MKQKKKKKKKKQKQTKQQQTKHPIMAFFPTLTLYILGTPYGQFQVFPKLTGSLESVSCFLQSSVDNTVHQSDKSRLLFSSAVMFKKPLLQTVWTHIRLLL